MTVAGNIYGVILNDVDEREERAPQFGEKPYGAPPRAPVVYMKPRAAVTQGAVTIPACAQVDAAPTLALLFARDASNVTADRALSHVGALCLALDISLPQTDYYRPAVAQKNGEGFLPIGPFASAGLPPEIRMLIDGETGFAWSLDRLFRPVDMLIAELSAFMTLRAGDMLLIGLPGVVPRLKAGQTVRVMADGLPTLDSAIKEAQS